MGYFLILINFIYKNKMHIKIEQFLESKKNSLKNFLEDYNVKDTYGYYEISGNTETLNKLKKELEENYNKKFHTLKIKDKKLIIFKKDIKYVIIRHR